VLMIKVRIVVAVNMTLIWPELDVMVYGLLR
jgi:hypothetical protein